MYIFCIIVVIPDYSHEAYQNFFISRVWHSQPVIRWHDVTCYMSWIFSTAAVSISNLARLRQHNLKKMLKPLTQSTHCHNPTRHYSETSKYREPEAYITCLCALISAGMDDRTCSITGNVPQNMSLFTNVTVVIDTAWRFEDIKEIV